MFANDQYGDCVIAGRAHQTLRFEAFEQNKVLDIKDKDVTREYFRESGGFDAGLVMLDSLNAWHNRGWRLGCCLSKPYKIYAFAQVNPKDSEMVRAATYLLSGVQTGILLPLSAQDQTGPDKVWDVGGPAGEWGGHCVFIEGYNDVGPIGITWSFRQQMTWRFFNFYVDECYGIIDDRDSWVTDSPLDIERLSQWLTEVS
jgi:hypothetical protein